MERITAGSGREAGQMLVLFVLTLGVLLGFVALAIDVGLMLHERGELQNVADAAALAGAQELPDDAVAAEEMARAYAEKNGLDPDNLDISFECTSEFVVACDPYQNRWDTILVVASGASPSFFAPFVNLVAGEESCWSDGCPVTATAAACRGLCGGDPTVPVDVVLILDRTGSMRDGDMRNAKEAAETLLETFDPDYHRVGLAVLGPSWSMPNPCQSRLPGEWLPVELSDDYQGPAGQLFNGSRLVNTIHCLITSSVGTDLGDPIAAAVAELQAHGRRDTKWGIVLLSDGAANRPLTDAATGWHNCASQTPVTSSSGDNNGYQQYPQKACTNGRGYARDWNSGTSTSTNCDSSGNDRHLFYDYGVSVPNDSTITGIEVRLDAKLNTWQGLNRLCVELSWDGGASWTGAKATGDINRWWTVRYLGGDGDTWGRTWTPTELADGNFMIRVTDAGSHGSRDFFLDWATVKVYYDTGIGDPCEYAADQADTAKALGIEIYTVGYGTEDNSDPGFTCGNDSGMWAGRTAEELLRYIATDEFHFFQEAKGEDLSTIFELIGQDLAGGSSLVR